MAVQYRHLITKAKKHPIYICIAFILLVCFLIFVYAHPLKNIQYSKAVRPVLPMVAAPIGTFSLITEPDQGIAPVLDLIKNSTHSIDLVMYEFNDKDIADALVAAAARGVAVRVLVNGGYYSKAETMNQPMYTYLQSKKIAVHWTPSDFALTHQKTLIVDQNQALIMTFNFVPSYYATARDFAVLDKDSHDVKVIEDTFQNDWDTQKVFANNGDDLVWSPGADTDTLLIINSAKTELDIYNEEMDDDRITQALIAARERGVAVKIVMTYDTNWKSAFRELQNSGIQIHLFHGQKFYIHAKMILADESYAFLGSQNFSYGSLNQNRELGIFLSDPTITHSLFNTFTSDWQNAQPF